MARLLPGWVKIWLVFSSIVCFYDGFFLVMRPRTLPDGDLAWSFPYKYWHTYCNYDLRYPDPLDSITWVMGVFDLLEVVINIFALALVTLANSIHGVRLAFTSTCFVFWKSGIFLSLFLGPDAHEHVAEADPLTKFLVLWAPAGIWVVFPFLVMVSLWSRLGGAVVHTTTSAASSRKKKRH